MGYARPGGQKVMIPELVQNIVENISSPETLGRLTRVHSIFTDGADRALYHSIHLVGKAGDITCLRTLSTNPRKASLVKFLNLYYTGENDNDKDQVDILLTALITAIPNLRTMTDLRIRFYLDLKDEHSKKLSNALLSCSRQLHTLYCNSCIELDAVRKHFQNLEVLGLFEWQDFPQATFEIIDLERSRDSTRKSWPCFICVDEDDKPFFTTSIFVALFENDDLAAKFQAMTGSINLFAEMPPAEDLVRGVTYYIEDFSNMSYICDITEHTAAHYPNLRVINYLVQNWRYKFQPNERFKKALTGLTELERLRFGKWEEIMSSDDDIEWPFEEQVSLAKEWRIATTSLTEVVFYGEVAVMYDPWVSQWKPAQYDPLDVLWW